MSHCGGTQRAPGAALPSGLPVVGWRAGAGVCGLAGRTADVRRFAVPSAGAGLSAEFTSTAFGAAQAGLASGPESGSSIAQMAKIERIEPSNLTFGHATPDADPPGDVVRTISKL